MEEKISPIGGCLFEQYVPFLCISYSIAPTKSFFFPKQNLRKQTSYWISGFSLSMSGSPQPPKSNFHHTRHTEHGECTLNKVEDAEVSSKTLRWKYRLCFT